MAFVRAIISTLLISAIDNGQNDHICQAYVFTPGLWEITERLRLENPHPARVLELLASDDADLIINSINVGEVYYSLARDSGIGAAEHFLTVILPSLPITVLGNSFEDVIAAARVKAGRALSYADCFAAATAIREHAPLVTGDPEFRKLGKTLEIDWVG